MNILPGIFTYDLQFFIITEANYYKPDLMFNTMVQKEPGTPISSRKIWEINKSLMEKVNSLIQRTITKYEAVLKLATMDHVRMVLQDLITMQKRLMGQIDEAIANRGFSEDDETDFQYTKYEMIDHLLEEDMQIDENEIRSVLLHALKSYRDILALLSLVSAEYSNPKIRLTTETISQGVLQITNKVQQLYDELVNADYW